MQWTREQDEILETFGSLGVSEVRRILHRECGVTRSEEAIRRHAYRIGASLIQYEICTQCGRRVRRLQEDNLCATCHMRRLAERQHRLNSQLLSEIRTREEDTNEYKDAHREYNRIKKQNSRLRKRHGIQPKTR